MADNLRAFKATGVPRKQPPDCVGKVIIPTLSAGTEGSRPGLQAVGHTESEVPAARVAAIV